MTNQSESQEYSLDLPTSYDSDEAVDLTLHGDVDLARQAASEYGEEQCLRQIGEL